MDPKVATGRIVWAEIADSNGIRKLRPAAIVTPTEQIVAGGLLTVVAITSRLNDPLPDDHVLLPWHAQGHPRTGLNRRCAAVCTWLAQISESDIQDFAGVVPSAVMTVILRKITTALDSVEPQPAPADPASPHDSTSPPHTAPGE
jgi:mRNA-degrading endonuclease toxin of MazEF toxin-antitoxin module